MGYSAEQIQFIEKLAPYVQTECIKRGYKVASPILAQASTESFKGQSLSKLAKQYNNFFGMKCGSSWTGRSVNMGTGEEYTKGVITRINANFRVYDNVEDGVKGYFDFINTKRYANLKTATTPEQYLHMIKADGYATSSTYVSTNLQRIAGLGLTKYDTFAKIIEGNVYTEPTENIRLNSTGNGVRWLQHMLNQHGYVLAEDGIAGNYTIGALMDYQKKNGLIVDGICGPLTRASLKI